MFLHIGEDVMVAEKEIIMMLPWEKERQRKSNITFLKECEKKQINTNSIYGLNLGIPVNIISESKLDK